MASFTIKKLQIYIERASSASDCIVIQNDPKVVSDDGHKNTVIECYVHDSNGEVAREQTLLAFVKMFNLVILGNPDYQWKGVVDPHSSVAYDYHREFESEKLSLRLVIARRIRGLEKFYLYEL